MPGVEPTPPTPPLCRPPRAPSAWEGGEGGLRPEDWQWLPPASRLPPLALSHGRGGPRQETRLRLAWSPARLHVLFDCEDDDPWGTFLRRDEPLYQEEVVEVFLAPGSATPAEYVEIEVSPLGALFDARISNPNSRRSDLEADLAWDCPGIAWRAGREEKGRGWWAALALPWASIGGGAGAGGSPSAVWRANFYRIDRPRDGRPAEFSAWSPTFADPADFHLPARFGTLLLEDGEP